MIITEQERMNYVLTAGAKSGLTTEQILQNEIKDWFNSKRYQDMMMAERYYRYDMDICYEKPNPNIKRHHNRLQHGFVRKLVNQKTDYLLTKPFSIKTDQADYLKEVGLILNKEFAHTLKRVGREAILKGIGWLQIYFENNKIGFKVIPSEQIIPLWNDQDHLALSGVIRVYDREEYEGSSRHVVRHVEYWSSEGVCYFVESGNSLIPDVEQKNQSHLVINGKNYNWEQVPIIPFKYNPDELAIICGLKELVDDYNRQKSIMADLLTDIPNFIYVLKNYGGQNLEEFLQELRVSNAIKVDNDGGVDKLQAQIDANAFCEYQKMNRKDIYEFGRGIDTQNENFGNASGVALKFRYADLDMDANALEEEFNHSLQKVLWFINRYLIWMGKKDYTKEEIEIVFNRNIIINEQEAIADCVQSQNVISRKTIMANHPWVTNVERELRAVLAENEEKTQEQKRAMEKEEIDHPAAEK